MKRLIASAGALLLSACGLQPMYAGGGKGAIARGLASVEVTPIEGRAGWLMRNALRDKLASGAVVAQAGVPGAGPTSVAPASRRPSS